MNYQETEAFLFNSFADFQKYGQSALIYDLSNIKKLCDALGNPQDRFESIHVAGTNGKGSSSHMLASVLQEAGYTTGLYTSPHLKSYTERIKINGDFIEKGSVVDFVNNHIDVLSHGKYSFFEITTAMAFDYFAKQKVDVAVIEVGLGGRLDATNIIHPVLSLITNISFDHVGILGNTIEEIAREKAGVIKPHVPVVISEYTEATHKIFMHMADEKDSDISFASKVFEIKTHGAVVSVVDKISKIEFEVILDLKGSYQLKNLPGILQAVKVLRGQGFNISPEQMLEGLSKVKSNTKLKGRWQILHQKPLVICDTAHNEAGIVELLSQALSLGSPLSFIVNFTREKELSKIIDLFPKDALFFTCEVKNPRMRSAMEVKKAFASCGLFAEAYADVNIAIDEARKISPEHGAIIVFGSNFLIAEINEL